MGLGLTLPAAVTAQRQRRMPGPQLQQAPVPVGQEEEADPYEAMIAAQIERMNQPRPDTFTPEQVQERRDVNDREYEMGLLGALSGHEGFGNVGGMVLKNAIAMRQPHVTEHGVADKISGKFSYNPEYLSQQEQAKLSVLQKAQLELRERRRTAADRKQEARERQQYGRDTAMMVKGAVDAGVVSQDKARQYTVEDRMGDDFTKEVKPHQVALTAFSNLHTIAQKGDAASDMAFIFQYMKMLDPGSVVKEGEFASVQNAAGVPDRILNMYNKARSGNFLNAQQRADMLGTAGRLAQQAQVNVDRTTKLWHARAAQRGLDPFSITGSRPEAAPAAAPTLPQGAKIRRAP